MMEKKVNIILVGATGSGKSSTINALFNMELAKVGVGVDPETDYITSYVLDNLTIWDTPGLGDGVHSDEKYNNMIIRKLSELDENGDPSCGKQIRGDETFCANCGAKVSDRSGHAGADAKAGASKIIKIQGDIISIGTAAGRIEQVRACLYLCFCWTCIPSVIALLEFFIALVQPSDENGNILA